MPERDLRFFGLVAIIGAFVLVESLSFKQGFAQDWIFVSFYLCAAAYAAWHRAWFACTTAVSVAFVRGMVALGFTGRPFEVASVIFAALFFLLIAVYVKQRDDLLELTREPYER